MMMMMMMAAAWRVLGWWGWLAGLPCCTISVVPNDFHSFIVIFSRRRIVFDSIRSFVTSCSSCLPPWLSAGLPSFLSLCFVCLWYYFKIRDEVKRLRMVSLTSASRIYTERTKTLCGILIIGRQLTLFCSHLTEFIRSSIVNLVSSGWMRRMQKIFIISSRIASRLLLRLPIIEEILLFRHITIALSSCPPIRFRFILIACCMFQTHSGGAGRSEANSASG